MVTVPQRPDSYLLSKSVQKLEPRYQHRSRVTPSYHDSVEFEWVVKFGSAVAGREGGWG